MSTTGKYCKNLDSSTDMSSCRDCFQDFFSIYLQFLLGEMVNVLLLGVLSVRVVDIDQIDRKDDGSGGNK